MNEVFDIIGQAMDGVKAAHEQNVIHRDLKRRTFTWRVSAMVDTRSSFDFGLARSPSRSSARMTTAGALLGTVYYVAGTGPWERG